MASERQSSVIPGFTIELRLEHQKVLLVGGGTVARRKLPGLLDCGAEVLLVDPAELPEKPLHPNLHHVQREYLTDDLRGARLVFAASSDEQLNIRVAAECATQGILCSRADSHTGSDFISPARLHRPPLNISISSSGQSPAVSAALRDQLDRLIPHSWQTAAELAGVIRRKLLTGQLQVPYNQQVLLELFDRDLLELIEQKDRPGIDRLLTEQFGAGFSLEDLRFTLPEGTP